MYAIRSYYELLAGFHPHLTGAVLSGSIGRHADVHLQLFTDNLKELEIFLLNQQVPFKVRGGRVGIGALPAVVPDLGVSTPETVIHLAVLSLV